MTVESWAADDANCVEAQMPASRRDFSAMKSTDSEDKHESSCKMQTG